MYIRVVKGHHENLTVGPASSVTIGSSSSIIRDNILISQPPDYVGDVDIIQQELSNLATVGPVTVTAVNAIPDSKHQCSWLVTFDSNAGDLPMLEVASSSSTAFSDSAIMIGGDTVSVTDNVVQGTSTPISGHFSIAHGDKRTSYLPYNVSAAEIAAALNGLGTLGIVEVTRNEMGVNNEYVWDITFKSHLGSQAILEVDSLDLKGTLARIFSSKIVRGSAPPFDGPDYQSITITNLTSLSAVLNPLKEGIDYYFRVSAINAMGLSDSTYSWPRTQKPHILDLHLSHQLLLLKVKIQILFQLLLELQLLMEVDQYRHIELNTVKKSLKMISSESR